MGNGQGSSAWYQATVELMGALVELRDHCQEPLPWALNFGVFVSDTETQQQSAGADAKEVETTTAPTHLVSDPVATAANEGQSAGADDKEVGVPTTPTYGPPAPLVFGAVRKWELMLAEVQRLLDKIGSEAARSFDGRVIRTGSGLFGKADDAFQQVEPLLRDAQLDPALGRFEIEGYGSQRCAWPVVAQVSTAVQAWARSVAEQWLNNPPEQPRRIANRLALAEVVDTCPLSPELVARLGARLDLERAWLSRIVAASPEIDLAGKESGKPGRRKKERSSDELAELQSFVDLHQEWEAGKASGNRKYLTSGTDPRSYEAFFEWLQREEKAPSDILKKWADRTGDNVMRQAKRVLPQFMKQPSSPPENKISISGSKSRKKKSKISKR